TRGLLCAATFAGLPPGAALIHCGRGAHLVEADLQAALADGRLRGALVDVYAQEPLPPQHPLWRCPSLVITPHMASVAPFERVAGQILENLRRLNAGEALMNLVDPRRGY
ncbi:NAD(P)-dependent oxidoreductase, partial [Bordetella pertussis]